MKRLRCLERFPIVIETHFWTRRRFFKRSARLVLAPNRSLWPASITLRVPKDITYCFVTSLRWYGWVFNTSTPIIHLSLEQWSGRIARTPSLTHAWLKPGRKSFVFLPGAPRWGKRHQTEPKSEVVPGLREPVWTPPTGKVTIKSRWIHQHERDVRCERQLKSKPCFLFLQF